ncbi:MAG: prolipoprotein diacylglyceryl transferase [Candidatus Parcubacteria bacterium]|jgi:phosphatidylglycerol:prolipoprotein diacylglycerol transferase
MLPVLLDLKFVKIYTFGLFLVLAFFWSSFLLWKNSRLTSYKEEDIFDGLFVSLLGALFVGRIFYVVFHFDKFGFNLMKFLLINGYPGLNLYGCLLGGFIAMALFSNPKKFSFFEVLDYVISPIFLALGIGKLGAFFSGVEVGAKTKFPLAIKYVNFDGLRHLTPFYESILFFIAAYLSYQIMYSVRRGLLKKGFLFYFFIWFFSLTTLAFDTLKSSHSMIAGHSFNAVLSLTLLLTSTGYFMYYFRSLIFKRFAVVSSFIFRHGRKNHKADAKGHRDQADGGEAEDAASDPGSEKE